MRRTVLIVGLVTAVLCTAVPASAQFQPPRMRNERPQRALFGSGVSNTEQSLVLNVSFGGGFSNDPTGQMTASSAPLGSRGLGQYGYGSASLAYSVSRETVSASANVGGTAQYYPDMPDSEMHSFAAGIQASWVAGKRTTLSASSQIAAQPNNLRSLYGIPVDSETLPDSSDTLNYAINGGTYTDWRTSASVSQRLTERLTASGGYTFYAVDYGGEQQSNYAAQSIDGRLTYQITTSLRAYGGYIGTITDYADESRDGRNGGRTIDAGLDFGQALSLTRRTSLTFGTGLAGVSTFGDVTYVFTGRVSLSHELGRSWTLQAGAYRSADFYQSFGDPVISTSASGGVSGALNRRVQVGAQAGWSTGTVGVSGTVPQFDSWTAGATMRIAVSRSAGLSFSYSVFDYLFDDNGAPLPIGVQQDMRNQSARVTFDWMLPLVTVQRRANASR
jgi:hypothetical protein